jgi:hypothetical protein
MKQFFGYPLNKIAIVVVLTVIFSCQTNEKTDFTERTKIALRDVGNKLLLSTKDSISLILPVIELETNQYQLSFNKSLYFEPGSLVIIIDQSLKAAQLPEHYRVEVVQCSDAEVAYSYQMAAEEESTIIPCSGRYLPDACYIIQVKFTDSAAGLGSKNRLFITVFLVLLGIGIFIYKKAKRKALKENQEDMKRIGLFFFYPEQNKLVKVAQEIALSKKECELLVLFVANPNQIIKRDELTKRVWEDNGVFVGRSLDTYISKLRKKLKADASIKLTNIHGIGYKLELA